jgi:hypothetical protein
VDGAAHGGGALGEAGEPVARADLADADGASWRWIVDDLKADAGGDPRELRIAI